MTAIGKQKICVIRRPPNKMCSMRIVIRNLEVLSSFIQRFAELQHALGILIGGRQRGHPYRESTVTREFLIAKMKLIGTVTTPPRPLDRPYSIVPTTTPRRADCANIGTRHRDIGRGRDGWRNRRAKRHLRVLASFCLQMNHFPGGRLKILRNIRAHIRSPHIWVHCLLHGRDTSRISA